MLFNLSVLITPYDLHRLDEPFSNEEIEQVVKDIPTDMCPAPDGFNGLFLKKNWHIIKEDFHSMIHDFYSGVNDMHNINTAYSHP